MENVSAIKLQIEIGNGGMEEFLISDAVEHLFHVEQMFHTSGVHRC